ncbi:MAG: glycosyltransferase family 2 protein [Acidiferrobacteraceae bacterium]|jgi:GT2 family glycosyltransferase
MSKSGLHVVIPVLNRWHQTRACLRRLLDQGQPPAGIVVVDHGSVDETAEGLATEFPGVVHLESDPEHWWTGASNAGIRTAMDRGASRIMLLNNDCLLGQGSLHRLLEHAEQNPDAVIAPVQRNTSGKVQVVTARTLFLLGFQTLIPPGSRRKAGNGKLLPTGMIVGGRGAIIPRTVFDRVGLFDEARLPHYGADHDFYLRCRKQGVPLRIAADAFVDIDETITTLAWGPGSLSLAQFLETLRRRRSHRNLRDLSTLFRLHYPIPGLWWVGVGLNLLRYTAVYVTARVARVFAPAGRK